MPAIHYKSSPLGSKGDDCEEFKLFASLERPGQLIRGFSGAPAPLDPSEPRWRRLDNKFKARAEISIPVTSLQSGTEGMDRVMQDDMNAKEFD